MSPSVPDRTLALTDEERQRCERIDQLAILGGSALPELLETLEDPSWTVRRAGVAALAALGDESVPALVAWLRAARTSEHAIAAAVDALVASPGTPTTASAIAALADDPNPAVVCDAATILGRRHARGFVPLLGTLLQHPDDNVAVAAIEALGRIAEPSGVDALVTLVGKRDFFRTFAAIQVLSRSGDPRAVAPLVGLLEDDVYGGEAIVALGRTGSPLALAPLVARLAVADVGTTRALALAITEAVERARFAGAARRSVALLQPALVQAGVDASRLVAALAGGAASERAALVQLLGLVGGSAALPTLLALATDQGDPVTAPLAATALRELGQHDESAILDALASAGAASRAALLPAVRSARAGAVLRLLLADEESDVRARTCEAFARIGDTSAVPALFALLADPSPRVVHAATAAIHSLGSAETAPLAIAALASPTLSVRKQALRILAYVGPVAAFDAVLPIIDEADPRIAELAVAALAALDDPRTEPELARRATSPIAPVRAAVLRAAAQRGGDAMIVLLQRGLGDDDAWVRYYACQGLGRLGVGASTAALIQRFADATPQVRVAAIEALSHIATLGAWQALVTALRADDPDIRRAALVGISSFGASHPEAIGLLLEHARSEDIATQLMALDGLAQALDPRGLAAVAEAACSEERELRDAAVSLLAGRRDAAAVEALLDVALAHPPEHPAHAALSRPPIAPDDPRVVVLAGRLGRPGAHAVDATTIAAALARMQAPAATSALVAALSAPAPAARIAAIVALSGLGTEGGRAALLEVATQDSDPEVRRVAAAATAS